MVQQGAWTFRYSLEGFLKRALYAASAPRTESQLTESVLRDWAAGDEKSRESVPDRVRASLRAKGGAFRLVGDDLYSLREAQGDDLQERAYHFLQESGVPQKQGEILRHLQGVTGRGRGELMSRLDLDSDPRFGRLESGEWLLVEWNLVNDQIAAWMIELGQRRAAREDLLALVADEEHEGQGQSAVFLPELDSRFAVVGESVECLLVEPQAAAAVEEAVLTAERTTESTQETEETKMNATTALDTTLTETAGEETTVQQPVGELLMDVLAQLVQAADRLQARNNGLAAEVVNLFDSEDLDGIKALMADRKRLEALNNDLHALVVKHAASQA